MGKLQDSSGTKLVKNYKDFTGVKYILKLGKGEKKKSCNRGRSNLKGIKKRNTSKKPVV